jgi:hypothetical protein
MNNQIKDSLRATSNQIEGKNFKDHESKNKFILNFNNRH